MGPLSIQWARPARFDLQRLKTWAERYGGAKSAQALARQLRQAVERLSLHPRLGRAVPPPLDNDLEDLRELAVAPFVIRYAVKLDRIVIIRVWHGREQRINTLHE